MNAVWLNDELMVSPETVAGLHLCWTNGDYENWFRKCRWYVEVIWTSGARQAVWWGQLFDEKWERGDPPEGLAPARAELRVAAQAEMERLSALLWPPRCDHEIEGMRCVWRLGHGGSQHWSPYGFPFAVGTTFPVDGP